MKKKKIIYAIITLVLIVTEVTIGVFVHDTFVRPYLGDVLVVILLYCLVRVIKPEELHLLPLYIFMFAAAVEILQGLNIADVLGISSPVLRAITGTVCDIKDIICYAVGCIITSIWEIIAVKTAGQKTTEKR